MDSEARGGLARPVRRTRRQGGFVLVLSMLVLIVLSGVGLYALRTSRIDLRAAGNMRLGVQAEYVAEMAVQYGLTQLLANPARVVGLLAGGASYTIPYSAGWFGENTSTYDTFGMSKSVTPQWSVTLSRAIDVSPSALTGTMVGSVGGTTARFRMKRLDATGTGAIIPMTGAASSGRTATEQVRAHVVVGPL